MASFSAAMVAALAACGTDFESRPARATDPDDTPTPQAQATVYRVIQVTPAPTETPIPLPDSFTLPGNQKPFPPELEPTRSTRPLPADTVLSLWETFLEDTHVVIETLRVDVHLCSDGRIIPGSTGNVVEAGFWGLRQAEREWHQVVLGREFGRNRLASIAVLSRTSGVTVIASADISPVSVTDSDVC